ncbi:glycine cleavage system P-protein-domain-containing protein [Podospora australis]|uniref:Glycine cleavage system P protein n=1 Tax=Podospora australis TaxID=1536484 RepID=A0AAN6WNZ7_9PEZI|nr:glycine cleavage system P-protein-domain-containing protein [Podospora australis]
MAVPRLSARLGKSAGAAVLAYRASIPQQRIFLRSSVRWSTSSNTPSARPQPSGDDINKDLERKYSKKARAYVDPLFRVLPSTPDFPGRHIGPDDASIKEMLSALSPAPASLDEFVKEVIPADILSSRPLFDQPRDKFGKTIGRKGIQEWEMQTIGRLMTRQTTDSIPMIGQGYYNTYVPEVIKRNILENPAWYTSYTPYQPEISQGRLESLLNFQTMVSDLTALPISNASLLDEGTAAAEAMTVSLNSLPAARAKREGKTFVVSDKVFRQTLNVLRGRAEGFGVKVITMDLSAPGPDALSAIEALGDDLVGVLVQYPDNLGEAHDFRALADVVHKQGALLSAATDLLALTLLTPPGEWGADIAFGNAQRFGVPLGNGGPHAAFFAAKDSLKRKIPGRLIGVSKDRLGGRALRLALQTREQHIRREKATSNVCTAQALLANMSAMYAVYHGPEGLKRIAQRCHTLARMIEASAQRYGFQTRQVSFDTVAIDCPSLARDLEFLIRRSGIAIKLHNRHLVSISVDETTNEDTIAMIAICFAQAKNQPGVISELETLYKQIQQESGQVGVSRLPQEIQRQSPYLTHPVFNTHHSETEMLRYIHHLQSKDLSLVHSMIPLGSCTMKLNSSTEMSLITQPWASNFHPQDVQPMDAPIKRVIRALCFQLSDITGMAKTSIQPNSGAQGEFAGLRVIRKYHESQGSAGRDICLIPVSAHGTNPASAAMAGMRVVPVKCDTKTGNLDLADLEAKCQQYAEQLGAIMITYPSTFGVFEPQIKKVCELVHKYGGQVYMDGANMNAQIGLCSPGEIGADVCHLNLHKTFCIPHGGGGPGVGPICVKEHLAPFLPSENPEWPLKSKDVLPISSATYGSASILPISWAYNAMMGGEGLKKATEVTLLNANYLLAKLKDHYPILYTNEHGRCAHEFILDVRPFAASAGIEAIDIAKRLQDYGFHAPTMSWPVANTLMIEPTESESKEELDRFVEALVSIREEIREIEEGKAPRENNVLKLAPHPLVDIIGGDGEDGAKWDRPYTRTQAAYPLPWLREKKFWPSVARVNDSYGDINLFCTCPPVEDTTGGNISSVQESN